MYRIALLLYTQVASFASVWLLIWGAQYIAEGYGIHPILSGAGAMLLFISPYLLPSGGESVV